MCGSAIAFGFLVTSNPIAASVVAGLVALWSIRALGERVALPVVRRFRWIPTAWLILFFISNWKVTQRSPLAVVSGSLTFENKIEIAAYALVAALAFVHLYPTRRTPTRLRVGPLLAWPLLAVFSATWSLIPIFSLIRSLQLFVPIALCIVMVRVWREDPRAGEILWRRTLRLIVQLITVLVIFGLITYRQWPAGRFTWPGAPHPIVASGIVGLGLLLLVAGGRALTGFSTLSYLVRIGLLTVAVLFGQTRSVLLGVAIAILVALWLAGRNRPGFRYLTIPVYVGAIFFAVASAQATVVDYLRRGQYGGISTLNGRLPLWILAIRDVAAAGRWLVGSGYGSTRVILFPQVNYAGEAHNSWVEFLIEVGLVGVVLAVVWVAFLTLRLFRNRPYFPVTNRAAAATLVYLVVLSGAENYLATPGFGYTTIVLLYALALAQDPLHRWRGTPPFPVSRTQPHQVARSTVTLPAG